MYDQFESQSAVFQMKTKRRRHEGPRPKTDAPNLSMTYVKDEIIPDEFLVTADCDLNAIRSPQSTSIDMKRDQIEPHGRETPSAPIGTTCSKMNDDKFLQFCKMLGVPVIYRGIGADEQYLQFLHKKNKYEAVGEKGQIGESNLLLVFRPVIQSDFHCRYQILHSSGPTTEDSLEGDLRSSSSVCATLDFLTDTTQFWFLDFFKRSTILKTLKLAASLKFDAIRRISGTDTL
ncbi:hypothetical protein CRE_24232 [Caenorhabditis remanei]|uniref:Uncharacterized protein n=1 Tax=Caenorhabditis remanei TaxID=31234 RepID=E3NCY2_CAERE|nr:hypothetical protein CRE_24232 [Caenorhabditis remanei]